MSSAGLRVILAARKQMNKQGSTKISHVNETIMEIFEITGFIDILTIENEHSIKTVCKERARRGQE